jgi:hypothetical protein
LVGGNYHHERRSDHLNGIALIVTERVTVQNLLVLAD